MKSIFTLFLATIMFVALTAYAVPTATAMYRDYDTFITAFKSLANTYPSLASYETIGKTVENRDIIMFKIGNPYGGKVMFDGAMHGMENLGSELLYSYAKWLLTSSDALAKRILTRDYTLLVPAVNVDEYDHARKNAHGVDLNRNFAYNWQYGTSDPTSDYYRGPSPVSEPESKAIVNVFRTMKPSFYVNLHRGGAIFYVNYYGNTTYYPILFNKMSTLSNERGVKPYGYQYISGAGYAMSDATTNGITSFLLEIIDWRTITLPEIETLILPRFIPVAAILSQECEAESALLFSDGFESGSFSSWNGTGRSTGESATVTSTTHYQGNYSAKFTSNGGGGIEYSYCYRTVPSSSDLWAQTYVKVETSGALNDGDRFYFVAFRSDSEKVASAGWRRVGGAIKWTLIIRDGTDWPVNYSTSTPSLNKWYKLDLYWTKDASNGHSDLYIDDALACSIAGKNTTAFGNVEQVHFGLAEVYYSGSTVAYCDSCTISSGRHSLYPRWDVNEDGVIDILDITIVTSAYASTPGQPEWDPRADVDANNKINLLDLVLVSAHYKEEYT